MIRWLAVAICTVGVWLAVSPVAHPAAKDHASGDHASAEFDPSLFRSFHWRNIGPIRGGRSIAVAGSSARPLE